MTAALEHQHPFLAGFGLEAAPSWVATPDATLLGVRGLELWVAGGPTSTRQALEAATGHPVHLYRSTAAELDLLRSLGAGHDSFAERVSRAVLEELPGGHGMAGFTGGGPPAFEAWLQELVVTAATSPAQVGEALSLVTGLPFIRLDEFGPSAALMQVVNPEAVAALRALPMHWDGFAIHYATPALPSRRQAAQVAALFGAARAWPLLCSPADFARHPARVPPAWDWDQALRQALLGRGLVTPQRMGALERLSGQAGRPSLATILVELGILSVDRLRQLSADLAGLPVAIRPLPDPAHSGLLTSTLAGALGAVVIGVRAGRPLLATSGPPDPATAELIQHLTGTQPDWAYCLPEELKAAIALMQSGGIASPGPLGIGYQLLALDAADRAAVVASANPWKALARHSGTRPRLVALASWAFGVPAVRELPGRLRTAETGSQSGELYLDDGDPAAWRPGLEPDELGGLGRDPRPGLAFRPVVVSHSHPNGGRSTPPGLTALLDRMEAAGCLPRGAAEASILRVCQDDEPVDQALLEAGLDPAEVAVWLAEAAGTSVASLEPAFSDRPVIDELGREVSVTQRLEPIDPEVARLLPADKARALGVIPVRREGQSVVVAIADPWGLHQEELKRHIDDPIQVVVGRRDQIEGALARVGGRRMIGQLLIERGLTATEVNAALDLQRKEGIRLGQALVSLGLLTELDVADLVAGQLQLPMVDPEPAAITAGVMALLPEEICRRHRLIPLHRDDQGLLIGMADPLDTAGLKAVEDLHPGGVRRAVVTDRSVTRILAHFHSGTYLGSITDELLLRDPENSARRIVTGPQKIFLIGLVAILVVGLVANALVALIVLNAIASAIFMAGNLLKVWLMTVSLDKSPDIDIADEEVAALADGDLPVYTILVPMYREARVMPLLVDGLRRLDYPVSKLDVKLLLEADDAETIAAASAELLPPFMEVLIVPAGEPRGKPRACNYGLLHARGEYVVIYDAEDRPEPDQLKKAVLVFRKVGRDVVCVQAKLNYFNRRQNLLTRWFTAEYSLWFDLLLPSIYALKAPIPLGGTSNHFITDRLRAAGAWDPFNVTEDADLGLRIHKRGWTTAIVNSTTFEEANSDVYNWIRQRSRWVKGYVQTYLVHMRHPLLLRRQLGWRGFLVFQVMIGGTVFSFLVNPIYWALTSAWFFTHWAFVHDLFPAALFYIGAVGLYVGNFAFTFASLGGCLRRGYYEEVKYALLTPAYWFLMSIAGWKGFLQLFYRPFYWEKTEHGLHLEAAPADG